MSDIKWLDFNTFDFPNVETALAEPDGLLAVGGDLRVGRLVEAYRCGIFPWYEESQPILWWSPNPRCVLFPDELYISRSLKKTLRKQGLHVSFDQAFADVIKSCGARRASEEGTWITRGIEKAYNELHRMGVAHSVEVWRDDTLVGGLYGLAMGRIFFGESMFSRETDASKVALYYLTEKLKDCGFKLIDCQVYSGHLESMGAVEIPRQEFLDYLEFNIEDPNVSQWV